MSRNTPVAAARRCSSSPLEKGPSRHRLLVIRDPPMKDSTVFSSARRRSPEVSTSAYFHLPAQEADGGPGSGAAEPKSCSHICQPPWFASSTRQAAQPAAVPPPRHRSPRPPRRRHRASRKRGRGSRTRDGEHQLPTPPPRRCPDDPNHAHDEATRIHFCVRPTQAFGRLGASKPDTTRTNFSHNEFTHTTTGLLGSSNCPQVDHHGAVLTAGRVVLSKLLGRILEPEGFDSRSLRDPIGRCFRLGRVTGHGV